MIRMYGIFNLRANVSKADYADAFTRFARHLGDLGYVNGWSFLERLPHGGYDAGAPDECHLVEIRFPDLEQADRCYAYIAANDEPLRSLHRNMNRLCRNLRFALYRTESDDPPSS